MEKEEEEDEEEKEIDELDKKRELLRQLSVQDQTHRGILKTNENNMNQHLNYGILSMVRRKTLIHEDNIKIDQ